jgi:porphobilinogen synthase
MVSDLVGPSAGDGRFPAVRPRRLRRTAAWRGLVAETTWAPRQLILPMFVREDATEPTPIASMPGVVQHSRDSAKRAVAQAAAAGLGGVMIFGVPTHKDPLGTGALDPEGILNAAVRDAVEEVGDALVVGADLCLDEFTDHGHCGVLATTGTGEVVVDNDATLAVYAQMAVALADAGAGVVAPSGMMDGQVGVIRTALDAFGYAELPIMAYAAKYASAFYGPFREAVASSLQGNRATYQQDNANVREALREVRLDVAEGADVVMVKPALGYLDVLAAVRAEVDVPVAAYNVSGEYAMVEAAAANGWIDRERTIIEVLTGIRRAGADMILTYWAVEAAGFARAGR